MHDRNENIMARWGVILMIALFVVVASQLDAGNGERGAKKAACAEAKAMLADRVPAVAREHSEGEGDSAKRYQEKDQAGREKLLVDAAATCAAYAVLPGLGLATLSTFLAAVGPFVGMMAFIVAGLRYDAGMRNAFGGGSTMLEIEPMGRTDGRRWRIRNVGLGPEKLVGVRVISWKGDVSVVLDRSAFERFDEDRRVEAGTSMPFDTTARGDDLLVAVLSRGADARHVASWARFRRGAVGDAYEKREEGRVLNA